MTNTINFSNVKIGEYTNIKIEGFDNIDLGVKQLKNGKYGVIFHQVTNLLKLKKMGYKVRSGELTINNEEELTEAIQKLLDGQWTYMKVIIE